MSIISAHLNEFYLQYATDQGLTMAQTEQQVGQWDIDHFKSAIDQLLSGVNPDEMLSQRLQVAYAQSKMTRRDMLNAMIAAGMAVATYKAQEYGKKAIVDDYQEGYRRRTGQEPLKQGKSFKRFKDYTDRLWIHGDVAKSRMQETLNTGLRRGLDNRTINRLTKVYKPTAARKASNLASDMNRLVSREQGLLVDQTTRSNQAGQNQAFTDADVKYCFVLTEGDEKVCTEYCEPLVGIIFPIDEAPNLPEDTHPGCRCQLIPCDADGNILPGFVW